MIGQSISLKIFSEIRKLNKELCTEIAGGYSPDALLGHTRTQGSTRMMWDLMKAIYYRRDPDIITQKRWVRFVIVYALGLGSVLVMISTLLYCFVLNVFFNNAQ